MKASTGIYRERERESQRESVLVELNAGGVLGLLFYGCMYVMDVCVWCFLMYDMVFSF